jgi:hypothetical protein
MNRMHAAASNHLPLILNDINLYSNNFSTSTLNYINNLFIIVLDINIFLQIKNRFIFCNKNNTSYLTAENFTVYFLAPFGIKVIL